MLFSRDYMPGLLEDLSSDKILLLIGARQVGKTSLMKQLQQHLVAQGKPTVFLYTEQMGVKEALDEHQDNLWQYLPNTKELIYVFIDEIQYLQDPTRFLKYQYDKWSERIKLIVS